MLNVKFPAYQEAATSLVMWPKDYCDGNQKERNCDPLRRGSVESLRTSLRELTNDDVSTKRNNRKVKCKERSKPRCSRTQPQCRWNKSNSADDEQGSQRDDNANAAECAELLQARQLAGATMCRVGFHGRLQSRLVSKAFDER